jgi:hypothetical protein
MTPTPAAVMNAVSRAVGRRITELPITAERLLNAMRATAEQGLCADGCPVSAT